MGLHDDPAEVIAVFQRTFVNDSLTQLVECQIPTWNSFTAVLTVVCSSRTGVDKALRNISIRAQLIFCFLERLEDDGRHADVAVGSAGATVISVGAGAYPTSTGRVDVN